MQEASDGWGRAWELARTWIEAPKEDLSAWLIEACADDEDLTREVHGLIRGAERAVGASEADDRIPALVGQELGPYRIEALIGSGGMGHVWRATHAELGKSVALKVLSIPFPDERARLRFEHEARIQAQLDHPNIARIHHSGVWTTVDAQELPWFSMDLVANARHVAEWRRESNADVREVLELIATVCDAVGSAHERGVIHRDLKPSNVLVDGAGRPVVIDFGIAHSASKADLTRTGAVPGTPRYLAPERLLSGDRGSTRSDVYALGLILYELLAGEVRYQISDGYAGLSELREQQQRTCPRLARRVPGVTPEVDWILAKATSHTETERYANATTLAQDIRNALGYRPVAARRPGLFLRGRRWIRRRPLIASLAVLALLATGLGARLWLESAERARAERQSLRDRASAQASLHLLSSALRKASPVESPGGMQIWTDFLDAAELDVRSNEYAPEFKGQFLQQIGEIRRGLGQFERALELADASVKATHAAPNSDHLDDHGPRLQQAVALLSTGRFEESIRLLVQLIADVEEIHPAGSSIWLDAQTNLASAHASVGRTDRARLVYQELIESHAAGEWLSENESRLIGIHSNLGVVLAQQGRFDDAIKQLQLVKDWRTEHLGLGHPETIESFRNYGSVLSALGRSEEAIEVLEQAAASADSVLGPEHLTTAQVHSQLGTTLVDQGKLDAGEEQIRMALGIKQSVFPWGHPSILVSEFELGRLACTRGDANEALAYLRPVLEQRRASLPSDSRLLLETLGQTGLAHHMLGQFDEAEALVGEAAARLRDTLGLANGRTQVMVINLAAILIDQARLDDSESLLLEVLDVAVPDSGLYDSTLDLLAQVHSERGDADSAIQLQESIYERAIRSTTTTAAHRVSRRNNFASSLFDMGQFERAEPLFRESVYEGEGHVGKEADMTVASRTNLARTLAALGRVDEAVELARETLRRSVHNSRYRELLEELLREYGD